MEKRDVTIVIPSYNEEGSIESVVNELMAYSDAWEIIVVNDGSSDRTAERAAHGNVRVINHPHNQGYGAALKTGIRAASHNIIVLMDADGQHKDFNNIDRLLEEIDTYDMVVGARSTGSHQPFFRRPGKWFLGLLANYLSRRKIPDLNSGFRAFKRDVVLSYLPLLSNHFSFTTTQTLMMFSEGRTVKYIPIKTYARVGKSTVKFVKDGIGTTMLILRVVMLFSPLRIFLPVSVVLFLFGAIRLFTGLVIGVDYTITSILGILSSVLVILFGLMADQIAALRKDMARMGSKND
jgi:glycosyltransferase involved in cell wall biosynthesis